MLRKLILSTTAAALLAAPVAAQAAQAAPVRSASPVAGEEGLGGALLPVLVALGLALLLILVIDNGGDPTSP